MSKVISFEAYEDIAVTITNINLDGYTLNEATLLLTEGLARFALCQGNCLTLVPIDYKLKMHEFFVTVGNNMQISKENK